MLGHLGVGAGQEHAEVGVLAARGPHLLAVDDPLVAVLDRPRLQAGQVRARLGLAEELAPGLLAGHDVAHVEVDLLLGAVGGDGRGGQQQAQPGRRRRARRTWRSPAAPGRRRSGPWPCRRRSVGRPGAAQPASPRRSHHSATVRSGSQLSPSQDRSSLSSSSVPRRLGRGVGHAPKLPGAPGTGNSVRTWVASPGCKTNGWMRHSTPGCRPRRRRSTWCARRRGVPETDVDLAEGYRWVTRLSRLALDWIVETLRPAAPPALHAPGRVPQAPGRQPRRALPVLRARRHAVLPAPRVPG